MTRQLPTLTARLAFASLLVLVGTSASAGLTMSFFQRLCQTC